MACYEGFVDPSSHLKHHLGNNRDSKRLKPKASLGHTSASDLLSELRLPFFRPSSSILTGICSLRLFVTWIHFDPFLYHNFLHFKSKEKYYFHGLWLTISNSISFSYPCTKLDNFD